MSDFEDGRAAFHFVMDRLANESVNFRSGYTASVKAMGGIGGFWGLVLDQKSVADEDDVEGWGLGSDAARETYRQVDGQSANWKAGWSYELRRPFEEQKAARAFDADVARRVEEKLAFHRLVQYKAATLRDPNQKSIPKPRSIRTDAEELAYIRAWDEQADITRRVERKMLEHHTASGKPIEYAEPPPTREQFAVIRKRFFEGPDEPKHASPPPDPHQPIWRKWETKDCGGNGA